MTDLNLHSLAGFDPLIGQILDRVNARSVVEIGAEGAQFSSWLARWAHERDGEVMCVDPLPSEALRDLAAREGAVRLLEEYSPAVLGRLQDADVFVLDGDHNWHTVTGELRAIAGRLLDAENPALALLHDVQWPCARRDFYYAPDRIPEVERHAHTFSGGVVPGNDGVDEHGLRGSGAMAVATRAGGERNGVLTAVEDFVVGTPGVVHRIVPSLFGLGVLYVESAPWAEALTDLLAPFDGSPFLERLEENRIALYLNVLRLQDEIDRRSGDQAQLLGALRRRVSELEGKLDAARGPST